ncbi:MAG: TIGR02996 domain-containing protein [Archangiaceae bacterium]|nr:TIGR02996 domain-containing protein [Archangiaceae bacterium]
MPSSSDSLLQLIYQRPDDDAARRSYADWLIERGDPRGELIVLQLARAARGTPIAAERREVELLLEHGRSWLGPFARSIATFRFERGFLARCELSALTRAMVGDPSWSTLEHVAFKGVDGPAVAELISHPVMRSLREASGVGPLAFAWLQAPGHGANLRALNVVGGRRVSLAEAKSRRGLQQLEQLTYD